MSGQLAGIIGSTGENAASIVGISGPGGWSAFSGELDWQF